MTRAASKRKSAAKGRRKSPAQTERVITRIIRASYDAAQNSDDTRRWWSAADSLSAAAANDLSTRKKLRERARYEAANNSYCKGIVLTLANNLIGPGPTLQMQTPDQALNKAIENAWTMWAAAVRLPDRLRVMKMAKTVDGEPFMLRTSNPTLPHPVKLDPLVIECDQVSSPYGSWFDPRNIDGIHFDPWNNPEWYDVMREHPGNPLAMPTFDKLIAADVIHWFRADRPGQKRGVPELTPALPLFAFLRRFILATVDAAEKAANFAAVLEDSNGEANTDATPSPMESLEIVRGMMTTLYGGQKLNQLKAEHPAATIEMFVKVLIREIARCLNMPWNVAVGDSSDANYSSARLDHLIYRAAIAVERQDCVAEVLDVLFAWFMREARLIPNLLPASIGAFPLLAHQWVWPPWDYLDPAVEAAADTERLTNKTATLRDIITARGGDWREIIVQQEREAAFREVTRVAERAKAGIAAPVQATTTDTGETQGPDVQATALNGAQIASLLLLADKLALKQYPPESVDAMIRASFPAIDPQLIGQMIDGLKRTTAPVASAQSPAPGDIASLSAAAAPAKFHFTGGPGSVSILRTKGGSKLKARRQRIPRFEMVAYTGGAMRLPGFQFPVVICLASLNIPDQKRPVLRGHRDWKLIGHTEQIVNDQQQLSAAGLISGSGPEAQEVLRCAKNNFPWQASVGVSGPQPEFIPAGQSVELNGRSFPGPCYAARGMTLNEISFVPLGADGNTSARIAAAQGGGTMEPMTFEQWLLGYYTIDELPDLDEAVKAALQKVYDAEHGSADDANADPNATPPVDPLMAASALQRRDRARRKKKRRADAGAERVLQAGAVTNITTQLRRDASAEIARQNRVRQICAARPEATTEVEVNGQKQQVNILETAMAEGWTPERTELAVLRATAINAAPFAFARSSTPAVNDVTIEAALCRTLGLKNLENQFKPEELEASHRQFKHGVGLQQVLLLAAAHNGYEVAPGMRITQGNIKHVLKAAFNFVSLKAGWTPISLPGIFSNTANKEILQGYMEEDNSWEEVGAVRSVSDFKAVTSYRLLDSMEYEKVSAGGEIKHGKLDEESYTRQVDTYAKMLALTRQAIINDDMSAFDDIKARLGRGAAQKFNNVFWTEFMSDAATFWTTTRTNYITGATTNLGTDGVGLGLAVKAFRVMKSPTADGGKRIGGRPDRIAVPPELETIADGLYQGKNVASVKVADGNTHAGKYKPVVVPWLSDSNFTGYSTTAFYLLRDPAIAAAVVASFLNGNRTPVIEDAEADFNVLGVQFRGYHDFGVDQAEYLCGVKSKGAA